MALTVSISWTASTDAVQGYNVYNQLSTKPLNSELIAGTSYTATVPSAGIYTFYVTSVENGVESVHSAGAKATVPPYPNTTNWLQKILNAIWLAFNT